MAPIRLGSGTGIADIRKGDGTPISQVRKGDGKVLWSGYEPPTSSAYRFMTWSVDAADGGSVSTWPEEEAADDMSLTNATYSDTAFYNYAGISGDGTTEGTTSTMGTFGSSLDTGFALALGFTTTSQGYLLGTFNDNTNTGFQIETVGEGGARAGHLVFLMRDDGADNTSANAVRAESEWPVDDGDEHFVIIQYDGTNLDMYFDTDFSTVNVTKNEGPTNFADFQYPMAYFARNVRGTIQDNTAVDFSHIQWFDSPLSQAERETVFKSYLWKRYYADVIRNGVWTWFNKPRAVRHVGNDDKTYVGAIKQNGDAVVASIDNDTKSKTETVLHSALEDDDHNNTAVLVLDDGRIFTGYNDHADTAPRYRISSSAEDISTFDAEDTLPIDGSGTSYSQLAQLSGESDRIYYFFRQQYSGNSDKSTVVCYTDDYGSTWTGPIELFRTPDQAIYWRTGSNDTDRIDLGLTHAQGGGADPKIDIRHCYIQNEAIFTTDGTQLATFTDTEPLVDFTNTTLIYDTSATGNHSWIWDCTHNGGNPQVVYAELVSTSNHNWRYARWDGSSWVDNPITSAGGPIVDSDSVEGYYSAGICLKQDEDGVVYLAVAPSRDASYLYRYETSDQGSTWTSTELETPPGDNCRPAVPRSLSNGPHSDLDVVWWNGDYDHYIPGSEYETNIIGPVQ